MRSIPWILCLVVAEALASGQVQQQQQQQHATFRDARLYLGEERCSLLPCKGGQKFNYKPGHTYEYDYEGLAVTSITGTSGDSPGLGMRARARVHVLDTCEFALTLQDVKLQETDPRDASLRTPNPSSWEFALKLEEHALRFTLDDGRVVGVCPESRELSWVLNVKRAIVASLQNTMVSFDRDDIITEDGLEGRCSTSYSVVRRDSTSLHVRLTKDLTSCSDHPHVRTVLQGTPFMTEDTWPPLMSSSHSCDQVISRAGHVISTKCDVTHVLRSFSDGESGATGRSARSLAFVRLFGGVGQFPAGEVRRASLELEEAEAEEDARLEEAEDVLRRLCDEKMAGRHFPSLFSALVTKTRHLNYDSLTELRQRIRTSLVCPNTETAERYLHDAIPMMGSPASIHVLGELIRSGEVGGSEARAWLTSIAFLPNPSLETLGAATALVMLEKPQALLEVSALTRAYCLQHHDCGSAPQVRHIVDMLLSIIPPSCLPDDDFHKHNIIVALKAIGNIGASTSAVESLLKCVSAPDQDTDIRLAAMDAFRRIPCSANREPLLELFRKTQEDSEVRISAFLAVMTCPTPHLLTTVHHALQQEESNQVGTFVWTYLKNAAVSSSPHKQTLRRLLSHLPLLRKFDLNNRKFSRNMEGSVFLESLGVGATAESNVVWSQRSFIPRSASLKLGVNVLGRQVEVLEVGGRAEGLEQLMQRYAFPDPPGRRRKRSLDNVKINRMDRLFALARESVKTSGFVRVFGNDLLYSETSDVSKDDFRGRYTFLKVAGKLLQQQQVQLSRSLIFLDTRLTFATAVGLPLHLSLKGTASLDLKLGGDYQRSSDSRSGTESSVMVEPRVAVEVAAEMRQDAGVSSSGLRMTTTLHTDTAAKVVLQKHQREWLTARLDLPQQQQDIISLKTRFATFRGEAEQEQELVRDNRRQVEACTGERLERALGLRLCGALSYPNASHVTSAPFFPLTGPVDASLTLTRTDDFESYFLEARAQEVEGREREGVFRVKFDTPGSRVDRKMMFEAFASGHDRPRYTAHLRFQSPWKSWRLLGNYKDDKWTPEFGVRLDVDRGTPFDFAVQINVPYRYNCGKNFTASFDLLLQGKAIKGDGRVDSPCGDTTNMNFEITGVTQGPVLFSAVWDRNSSARYFRSVLKLNRTHDVSEASIILVRERTRRGGGRAQFRWEMQPRAETRLGGQAVLTADWSDRISRHRTNYNVSMSYRNSWKPVQDTDASAEFDWDDNQGEAQVTILPINTPMAEKYMTSMSQRWEISRDRYTGLLGVTLQGNGTSKYMEMNIRNKLAFSLGKEVAFMLQAEKSGATQPVTAIDIRLTNPTHNKCSSKIFLQFKDALLNVSSSLNRGPAVKHLSFYGNTRYEETTMLANFKVESSQTDFSVSTNLDLPHLSPISAGANFGGGIRDMYAFAGFSMGDREYSGLLNHKMQGHNMRRITLNVKTPYSDYTTVRMHSQVEFPQMQPRILIHCFVNEALVVRSEISGSLISPSAMEASGKLFIPSFSSSEFSTEVRLQLQPSHINIFVTIHSGDTLRLKVFLNNHLTFLLNNDVTVKNEIEYFYNPEPSENDSKYSVSSTVDVNTTGWGRVAAKLDTVGSMPGVPTWSLKIDGEFQHPHYLLTSLPLFRVKYGMSLDDQVYNLSAVAGFEIGLNVNISTPIPAYEDIVVRTQNTKFSVTVPGKDRLFMLAYQWPYINGGYNISGLFELTNLDRSEELFAVQSWWHERYEDGFTSEVHARGLSPQISPLHVTLEGEMLQKVRNFVRVTYSQDDVTEPVETSLRYEVSNTLLFNWMFKSKLQGAEDIAVEAFLDPRLSDTDNKLLNGSISIRHKRIITYTYPSYGPSYEIPSYTFVINYEHVLDLTASEINGNTVLKHSFMSHVKNESSLGYTVEYSNVEQEGIKGLVLFHLGECIGDHILLSFSHFLDDRALRSNVEIGLGNENRNTLELDVEVAAKPTFYEGINGNVSFLIWELVEVSSLSSLDCLINNTKVEFIKEIDTFFISSFDTTLDKPKGFVDIKTNVEGTWDVLVHSDAFPKQMNCIITGSKNNRTGELTGSYDVRDFSNILAAVQFKDDEGKHAGANCTFTGMSMNFNTTATVQTFDKDVIIFDAGFHALNPSDIRGYFDIHSTIYEEDEFSQSSARPRPMESWPVIHFSNVVIGENHRQKKIVSNFTTFAASVIITTEDQGLILHDISSKGKMVLPVRLPFDKRTREPSELNIIDLTTESTLAISGWYGYVSLVSLDAELLQSNSEVPKVTVRHNVERIQRKLTSQVSIYSPRGLVAETTFNVTDKLIGGLFVSLPELPCNVNVTCDLQKPYKFFDVKSNYKNQYQFDIDHKFEMTQQRRNPRRRPRFTFDLNHKVKFAWDSLADRKVEYDLQVSNQFVGRRQFYTLQTKLAAPLRTLVMNTEHKDYGNRVRTVFIIKPDFDKRPRRLLKVSLEDDSARHTKVLEIHANQRMILRSRVEMEGDGVVFAGDTAVMYSPLEDKMISIRGTLKNTELLTGRNVSFSGSITHSPTDLNLGVGGHMCRTREVMSSDVSVYYVNSSGQGTVTSINGDINMVDKSARLEVKVPETSCEVAGRLATLNGEETVSVSARHNGAPLLLSHWSLDPRHLELYGRTDLGSDVSLHLYAGLPSKKKAVVKVYHITNDTHIEDGSFSLSLEVSRSILYSINWRPGVFQDATQSFTSLAETATVNLWAELGAMKQALNTEVNTRLTQLKAYYEGTVRRHMRVLIREVNAFLLDAKTGFSCAYDENILLVQDAYNRLEELHGSFMIVVDETRMAASEAIDTFVDNWEVMAAKAVEGVSDMMDNAKYLLGDVLAYLNITHNFISDVSQYLKQETNEFLTNVKEMYLEFASTVYDFASTAAEHLAQVVSPNNGPVVQAIRDRVAEIKWAYKYWEVDAKLEEAVGSLRDYLFSEFDAVLNYDRNRVRVWEPEEGRVSAQLYLPVVWRHLDAWPRLTKYHFIARVIADLKDDDPTFDWDLLWRLENLYSFTPGNGRAVIIGDSKFVTFDGKMLDFAGTCSYVLTRDFMRNNFTIIVNYVEGVREFLTILASGAELRVFRDGRIALGRRYKELPLEVGGLTAHRRGHNVEVRLQRHLTVTCNLHYDSCSISVDSPYFARLGGLLGNYNYEPFDDIMTSRREVVSSVEEVVTSWEVGRSCSSHQNLAPETTTLPTSQRQQECTALFESDESALSRCFRHVPTIEFRAMCLKTGVCRAALAYSTTCGDRVFYHSRVLPEKCMRCEVEPGHYINQEETAEIPTSGASDLVVLVEERTCNRDMISWLPGLIRAVGQASPGTRFGLMSYGVDSGYSPLLRTIDGKNLNTANRFVLGLQSLALSNATWHLYTQHRVLRAMEYFPFRPGSTRAVLLVPCSGCDARPWGRKFFTRESVAKAGASLHILTSTALSGIPRATVYGLDSEHVYFRRSGSLQSHVISGSRQHRDLIEVPQDLCSQATAWTNGSIFTRERSNNHPRYLRDFKRAFSHRLSIALEAPEGACQVCECRRDESDVGVTHCRPCEGSPAVRMPGNRQRPPARPRSHQLQQQEQQLLTP